MAERWEEIVASTIANIGRLGPGHTSWTSEGERARLEFLARRLAEWECVAKTHGAEPTPEGLRRWMAAGPGDE